VEAGKRIGPSPGADETWIDVSRSNFICALGFSAVPSGDPFALARRRPSRWRAPSFVPAAPSFALACAVLRARRPSRWRAPSFALVRAVLRARRFFVPSRRRPMASHPRDSFRADYGLFCSGLDR
jgi:hypothetical protein